MANVTGDVPVAIGQVFKQGDLPSGRTLAGMQCTVKSTWPDGSARFAVVASSVQAARGQWMPLHLVPGDAPPGALVTTGNLRAKLTQPVTISAGAFGTATWSGADWDSPLETWVSGPVMSSWVYRKPIGNDPHLVAWLEVRLFATGALEVLPWIENGYATGSQHTLKSATFSFSLGGTQRFTQAIDLPNFCRTPLLAGSMLAHFLDVDPGLSVRHDSAYLMATEMVPTYGARTPLTSSAVTSLPATFVPLQRGSYAATMGSAGYDKSIGLLPQWDVVYLTSDSPDAWAAIQRNGYSAGRYGLHRRDSTTHAPIRFSQHPHLALPNGANDSVSDASGYSHNGSYAASGSGTRPPAWATSHHPSVGFMAALVSGRLYHVETAQFAVTTNYLKFSTGPDRRNGADGLIFSSSGSYQVRGAAWALRSLVQAAAITPDASPLQAEFKNCWQRNVEYYHAKYVAQAHNPQGWVQPNSDQNDYFGLVAWMGQPWMDDFFTAAIGYGKSLDLVVDPAPRAKLDSFFAWKAQAIIGRLGGPSQSEYLYRDAGLYMIPMAPFNQSGVAGWESGAGPWYPDWGALWMAANNYNLLVIAGGDSGSLMAGPKEIGNNTLRGTGRSASSYWANLQPALAYAVRWALPGALEAHSRLLGMADYTSLVGAQAGDVPEWAVVPSQI